MITPSAGSFADPIWDIGDLAAGGSETLTVVLTVGGSAAEGTDLISDTARLAALDQPDTNPGNDSYTESTSIIRVADVAVTKTDGVTSAVPGRDVTYTIVVSNVGPSPDAAVSVVDLFPPVLTPQSDLAVVKTESADPVRSGSGQGNLTYTIVVTNDGPSDATGVDRLGACARD